MKLKLYESGKLQELDIDWKVVATVFATFAGILKLIVKWIIIFTIAIKGLISDPHRFSYKLYNTN